MTSFLGVEVADLDLLCCCWALSASKEDLVELDLVGVPLTLLPLVWADFAGVLVTLPLLVWTADLTGVPLALFALGLGLGGGGGASSLDGSFLGVAGLEELIFLRREDFGLASTTLLGVTTTCCCSSSSI